MCLQYYSQCQCLEEDASLQRASSRVARYLAVLCTLTCSSCTSLRVTHVAASTPTAPRAKTDGVPFFTKKAKCQQTVAWLQPVYTIAISAVYLDKNGLPQPTPYGAVSLSRSNFLQSDVAALVQLVTTGNTQTSVVQNRWQTVVALASHSPAPSTIPFGSLGPEDRILAGKSSDPFPYVDYSEQYYLNAKVPWSGSANIDAKLATDGTLTEASGQVQNSTLQTILSSLPVSSLITGGLGIGGTKDISTTAGSIQGFQLTITTGGYLHTLSQLIDFRAPCPSVADITLAEASTYKREDLSAPLATQAKQTQPTNPGSNNPAPPGGNNPAPAHP